MKQATLLVISLLWTQLFFAQSTTYSLRFWGVSDYVHVPNCQEVKIGGDITIMFDIRIKDTTSMNHLMCLGNATSTAIADNDLFFIKIAPGGTALTYSHDYSNGIAEEVTFNYQLAYDQWTHVAIVRDSSAKLVHMYVEGTIVDTKPYFNQPEGGSNDELEFGQIPGGANGYLNSLLDNIMIWDYNLEDSTHFLTSQCLPNGSEPGLVAWWDFNEGTGVTVNELINNNDGILYGTSLNWRTQHRDYACTLGYNSLAMDDDRELIKIYDLMGRETEAKPNTLMIYLYSDGTIEKIFKTE